MTRGERLRIALRYTFAFGQGHLSTFLSSLSMLGLVLAIGLLIGAVATLKSRQDADLAGAMAGGPPPAVVTSTEVSLTQWAQRIEAVGDLTAIEDVAIASEVPGKVTRLIVRVSLE